jgi:hypothetical protein
MSSTLSFLSRLASTPMTSLLRGRLAPSKRDLRDQLLASGLPEPTRQLIGTVVKRAKLWRIEQADVQAELIAHFRDGIDAGAAHDELVKKFGDAETAAKLIRRAKIRNRPLAWHVKRLALRTAITVVVLYAGIGVYYYAGQPTMRTDYSAVLREASRVPDDQRAWPLVVEAQRMVERVRLGDDPAEDYDPDALPGDANWAKSQRWLDRHADVVALAARAAQKPHLGYDFRTESWDAFYLASSKPELRTWASVGREKDWLNPVDLYVPPHALGAIRSLAWALCLDGRQAIGERDASRLVRRVREVASFATLLRETRLAIETRQLVALDDAVKLAADALRVMPDALSNAQLAELAHVFAGPRTARDLIDYDDHRVRCHAVVQRFYTDDGQGDGRLTAAALERLSNAYLPREYGGTDRTFRNRPWHERLMLTSLFPAVVASSPSRREALGWMENYASRAEAALATPYREGKSDALDDEVATLFDGSTSRVRNWIFDFLWSRVRSDHQKATLYLARRDALLIAIACEAHRRIAGTYPETLDRLVPGSLPAVPEDPFDGKPLRYAVRDGNPFVYSVGADGDDDGGRLARKTRETPYASNDGAGNFGNNGIDADWILFPEPPAEQQTVAATQPGQ